MGEEGRTLFKTGADYRELRPASHVLQYNAAALLNGIPSGGNIQALERVDLRSRNFGAYLQDSWRASSRLTLNLGVRWDVNPALSLAGGKKFTTVTGIEQPGQLRLLPKERRCIPQTGTP